MRMGVVHAAHLLPTDDSISRALAVAISALQPAQRSVYTASASMIGTVDNMVTLYHGVAAIYQHVVPSDLAVREAQRIPAQSEHVTQCSARASRPSDVSIDIH